MEPGRVCALDKTSFHLRVVPVSSLYQDDDFVASIIRNCDFANVSDTIGSLKEQDIFLTQSDSNSL